MRTIRISPRKALAWVHRWVGLTLGLVFVGYGLTGSYIVYMDEFESWLKPTVKYASAPVAQPSIAALAEAVGLSEGALSVRVPADPARAIEFRFHKDPTQRLTEYLDPAQMARIGTHAWSSSLTGVLYTFHHDLFLGKLGKTVTAWQASLVFIMLLAGLVLWVPIAGQRMRAALKPDGFLRARSTLRRYLELHKFVGIYALLLLLITVGFGIVIARPDWFLSFETQPPLASEATRYEALESAIERAGLPPRGYQLRIRAESVTLTRSDGSAYMLNPQQGRFEPRVDGPYDFIRDVHGGRYWSGQGALITFVAGLLPLFFYITGLVVWWRKRQNRTRR